jgi:hypothetical protein
MVIGGNEPWRTDTTTNRKSLGDSLDRFFFTETASILSNYAHFLAAQTGVLDRHAEQHVLVLLVVGSKGVLVEQYVFGVIRAGFREVGEILSNRSDQAGLPLHAFIVGHRAMRIPDSEHGRGQRVAEQPSSSFAT